MNYFKYAGLALVGIASLAAGDTFIPPKHIACKVSTVTPEFANFFSFNPAPQVNDTITLDLTQNEITDLTFSQGDTIPLSQVKAKLVRKDPNPAQTPYSAHFEGTYSSPRNDYVGILHVFHQANKSAVEIQVLQKPHLGLMTIDALSMDCTKID